MDNNFIFVAYGFVGGIVATVVTEFVQGLLIIVMSLLIIPFGLARIGGFAGLHCLLPAEKFNLTASEEITWAWILIATLINLIGIVAQPHIMEVCSTGKSEFEGRIGFTYGSFVKRICALGWMLTGLIVLALVQAGQINGQSLVHQREAAFGVGIRELLPAGFIGLMFASILAAQMSTLSALWWRVQHSFPAICIKNILRHRPASNRCSVGHAWLDYWKWDWG